MRTLAVIPARLGATRLPRKPLRLLAGIPLVVRVWQRVVEIGVADRVVVATDSDEVADVVEDATAAERFSPRADHVSGTHRVAEVARRPEFARRRRHRQRAGRRAFRVAARSRRCDANGDRRRFPLGTAAVMATPQILARPERRESRRCRRRSSHVFFAGADSVSA